MTPPVTVPAVAEKAAAPATRSEQERPGPLTKIPIAKDAKPGSVTKDGQGRRCLVIVNETGEKSLVPEAVCESILLIVRTNIIRNIGRNPAASDDLASLDNNYLTLTTGAEDEARAIKALNKLGAGERQTLAGLVSQSISGPIGRACGLKLVDGVLESRGVDTLHRQDARQPMAAKPAAPSPAEINDEDLGEPEGGADEEGGKKKRGGDRQARTRELYALRMRAIEIIERHSKITPEQLAAELGAGQKRRISDRTIELVIEAVRRVEAALATRIVEETAAPAVAPEPAGTKPSVPAAAVNEKKGAPEASDTRVTVADLIGETKGILSEYNGEITFRDLADELRGNFPDTTITDNHMRVIISAIRRSEDKNDAALAAKIVEERVSRAAPKARAQHEQRRREPADESVNEIPREVIEGARVLMKVNRGITAAELHDALNRDYVQYNISGDDVVKRIIPRLSRMGTQLPGASSTESQGVLKKDGAAAGGRNQIIFDLLTANPKITNEEIAKKLKLSLGNVNGPVMSKFFKIYPEMKAVRKQAREEGRPGIRGGKAKPAVEPAETERTETATIQTHAGGKKSGTGKASLNEIAGTAHRLMREDISLGNKKLVAQLKKLYPRNPISDSYVSGAIIPLVYRMDAKLRGERKKARMEGTETPAVLKPAENDRTTGATTQTTGIGRRKTEKASEKELVGMVQLILTSNPGLDNPGVRKILAGHCPKNRITPAYAQHLVSLAFKATPVLKQKRKEEQEKRRAAKEAERRTALAIEKAKTAAAAKREAKKTAALEKDETKASKSEMVDTARMLLDTIPGLTNAELARLLKKLYPLNEFSEKYVAGTIVFRAHKLDPRLKTRKEELRAATKADDARRTQVIETLAKVTASMKEMMTALDGLTKLLADAKGSKK